MGLRVDRSRGTMAHLDILWGFHNGGRIKPIEPLWWSMWPGKEVVIVKCGGSVTILDLVERLLSTLR